MKFENIGKYIMEFECTCVLLLCNKVLAGINILLVEGNGWQPLLFTSLYIYIYVCVCVCIPYLFYLENDSCVKYKLWI